MHFSAYLPDADRLITQYNKLMETLKTSRQIALDTIKQAIKRSGSDDYSLTPEEYRNIEDYREKILELRRLGEYMMSHEQRARLEGLPQKKSGKQRGKSG
jgi:hypothetical protein